MGWTGIQYFGGNRKEILQNEFFHETESVRQELIDCSLRGSTIYGIYRHTDKQTGKQDHEGIVILTSLKDGWLSYKEMGESVGPYYFNPPISLLDKLDALGEPCNEFAREWRTKCREFHKKHNFSKKVAEGSLIKFAKPLNFGHFQEDTFRLLKDGKRTLFRTKANTLCRISKWKTREFTIIEEF